MEKGWTEDELKVAGFFEDNLSEGDILKVIIEGKWNAFDKVRGYPEGKRIALIYPGCFAPLTKGHLEVANLAREYFENLRYEVSVIFVPAHDSYVSTKTKDYPLEKRLEIIKSEIGSSSFLSIDDEPARNLSEEINFPWILEKYEPLVYQGWEVGLLCGEDNAGFAWALEHSHYHTVIVERLGGSEKVKQIKNDRIHFLTGNQYKDESSTRIRLSNQG
jgi:cytidyltransferase-like protein